MLEWFKRSPVYSASTQPQRTKALSRETRLRPERVYVSAAQFYKQSDLEHASCLDEVVSERLFMRRALCDRWRHA
jgi:hypothetical protein